MEHIAELSNVNKSFAEVKAIQNMSLAVAPGETVGILGPSGSGKTSLVRLLLGILAPDSGEVRVFGRDPRKLGGRDKGRLGYSPQLLYLYNNLTVNETMNFYATAYGLGWIRGRRRQIPQLLEEVDLMPAKDRLVGNLSGGMRKRLSIARALINDPDLVFLDEPTAGIDPILRQQLWEYFRSLGERGKSLFVTTHYAAEAEYCQHIAIVSGGRLIAFAPPAQLRREALGGDLIDVTAPAVSGADLREVSQLDGVDRIEFMSRDTFRIHVKEAASEMPRILETLRERNIEVQTAVEQRPPFDEVFAELVRRDNAEQEGAEHERAV